MPADVFPRRNKISPPSASHLRRGGKKILLESPSIRRFNYRSFPRIFLSNSPFERIECRYRFFFFSFKTFFPGGNYRSFSNLSFEFSFPFGKFFERIEYRYRFFFFSFKIRFFAGEIIDPSRVSFEFSFPLGKSFEKNRM